MAITTHRAEHQSDHHDNPSSRKKSTWDKGVDQFKDNNRRFGGKSALGKWAIGGLAVGLIPVAATALTLNNAKNEARGFDDQPVTPPRNVAEGPVTPGLDTNPAVNEQPSEAAPSRAPREVIVTEPAGVDFSETITARGIEIPEDIQQERTKAVEFCTTGEGASEMTEGWTHYGFDQTTGMSWQAAFAVMGDGAWLEPKEMILGNGKETYANINVLAENCLEAAYLASGGINETFVSADPEQASAALDEMRNLPYKPDTEVMTKFNLAIQSAYDNGYINRPAQ